MNQSVIKSSGQIALAIDHFREPDRNFEKGGRSFYFFDFDDNVVHLPSKIFIFNKKTHEELEVSTTYFAEIAKTLGKSGPFENFEIRETAHVGSFRNFREIPKELLKDKKQQPLLADVFAALQNPFLEWRGPSWNFFVHAVNNGRPISIITARGHHPHTIRQAINILVQSRDLPVNPNYLSLYPVSDSEVRKALGDKDLSWSVAHLKKAAIHAAVKDAFECYGENPHHRFGMSDDDPHNVELIIEAMKELKVKYPDNAFFVINTAGGQLKREEILLDHVETTVLKNNSEDEDQLPLI